MWAWALGAALLFALPSPALTDEIPALPDEVEPAPEPLVRSWAEEVFRVGRQTVRVSVEAALDERGVLAAHLIIRDTGRAERVLYRAEVPAFFTRHDAPPDVHLAVQPVRGFTDILRVNMNVSDEDEGQATWELVVLPPDAPTPRRGRWEHLWSSRRSGLEVGEVLEIIDPDGSGRDRILTRLQHPSIQACGRPEIPLAPRLFDPRSGNFRPAALSVEVGEDAVELEPVRESPFAIHVDGDAPLQWKSSTARSPVFPGHGRVPDELTDGLAETGWVEGAPGFGPGSFLTGEVLPGFRVAGLTLHTGIGDEVAAPTMLLLTVDDGRSFVLRPTGGVTETWTLPEDVETRCYSVVIVGGPPVDEVGIAELRVHTQIDRMELRTAVMDHLLPMLREHLGTPYERRFAQLLTETGTTGLPVLMDALDEVDGRLQAVMIRPISRIEGGPEALTAWIARASPGRLAMQEFARIAIGTAQNPSHVLIPELLVADSPETRARLLRVLSRSIDAERGMVFVGYLGEEDLVTRDAVRLGLSRVGIERADDLMRMVADLEGRRQRELMRTLVSVRRRAPFDPVDVSTEAAEALDGAMDVEDGTIARLAVALAGLYGVQQLRERLLFMARQDEHPFLRAAAVKAIGDYVLRRPDERAAVVATLEAALVDSSPTVRLAAVRTVRRVELTGEVRQALLARLGAEGWAEIRRGNVQALVHLKEDAVDREVVADLVRRGEGEVRAGLRAYQNRIGPMPLWAIEQVDEAFPEHVSIQLTLVQLTARSGSADANDWLAARLDQTTTDPRVFHAALEASARRRIPEARPLILELLTHEDPALRRFAARACAWYDDPEVLLRLDERLAVEEDRDVRRSLGAARDALRSGTVLRRTIEDALDALEEMVDEE